MYSTTILQWLYRGEWHPIGWAASNPQSKADLKRHGQEMANNGGEFRLVTPSIYADEPPHILHVFTAGVLA